jgi:hypothetical protein
MVVGNLTVYIFKSVDEASGVTFLIICSILVYLLIRARLKSK